MTDGPQLTTRVQKVLGQANAEAARLRHEYIGTEHILLGLVREREGVAIVVLRNLGVDVEALPALVEAFVKKGRDPAPDLRERPLTSRTKHSFDLARAAATSLGHPYVDTEHVLLGLLDEGRNIAAQILQSVGVTGESTRREVRHVLGPNPE